MKHRGKRTTTRPYFHDDRTEVKRIQNLRASWGNDCGGKVRKAILTNIFTTPRTRTAEIQGKIGPLLRSRMGLRWDEKRNKGTGNLHYRGRTSFPYRPPRADMCEFSLTACEGDILKDRWIVEQTAGRSAKRGSPKEAVTKEITTRWGG